MIWHDGNLMTPKEPLSTAAWCLWIHRWEVYTPDMKVRMYHDILLNIVVG
jgi:hypothetical protein